jgi:aspartyl-tRNA(Asn)/glutamyl-tRNA(Gln) amidotransferase subunit B
VLREGGILVQETRRWDDVVGITENMRTKEDAHDYRYFPDPDLMPHTPSGGWISKVRASVKELPLARKQRLMADFKLPSSDAVVFVGDAALGDYFEVAAKGAKNPKAVANWVINNLQAKLSETGSTVADVKFETSAIGELVGLVEGGKISSKIAQDVFAEMFESGKSPAPIVEEKGLSQVCDTSELQAFCNEAIEANSASVEDFKNGKEAALNFLKGQVMKASRGKANPKIIGELLKEILGS